MLARRNKLILIGNNCDTETNNTFSKHLYAHSNKMFVDLVKLNVSNFFQHYIGTSLQQLFIKFLFLFFSYTAEVQN